LLAAFVIAVTHGRVIDSVIIAVLVLPALAFVVLWATGRTRRH
jgi:choline-glycine betaine transporter